MPAPRILIVDDQRDISRMLRAALETLRRGYVIVDVPSAEEAQLEMRRGPVDLLITDLRLPGISGLELLRRLQKASSEAALIVISAYADETAQAEFRSLGATFFAKPLDLAAFLKGVQTALEGREPLVAAPGQAAEAPNLPERLARLRRDLGALAALLLPAEDREGLPLAQAGEAANLDLRGLLPEVRRALAAALNVSRGLGAAVKQPAVVNQPANVLFFDGGAYSLYAANVGAAHLLLIVFDGQRGGSQVGQVVRYSRQASEDLLKALPLPAVPAPEPAHRKKTGPIRKKTAPLSSPEPARPAPARPAPLSPEALQALDAAEKKTTSQAAAEFWEGVDGSGISDDRAGTLTWEQAAKLGLVKGGKPE